MSHENPIVAAVLAHDCTGVVTASLTSTRDQLREALYELSRVFPKAPSSSEFIKIGGHCFRRSSVVSIEAKIDAVQKGAWFEVSVRLSGVPELVRFVANDRQSIVDLIGSA